MTLKGKPKAYYRPILKSALHHVFVERDVWLFGIFATLIASGSAIETVLRTRNGLEQFGSPFLSQLLPSFETARQWFDQLAVLSTTRTAITLVVGLSLLIGIIILAALAQGAIVYGAKKHRKRLGLKDLLRHARQHLWQILAIDVLLKVSLTIAVLILLTPLLVQIPVISDTLLFLQALVGYGLMLAFSLIAIYAITAVVNHNQSLREGLGEAWQTFRRYPWTSLEVALLLFFINLCVGILVLLGLLLISIPYTILFLLGAAGGSVLATTLATAITFFIGVALLVVLGGATTAYNYTVLSMLYAKLRRGHVKSKLHRITQTRHWF